MVPNLLASDVRCRPQDVVVVVRIHGELLAVDVPDDLVKVRLGDIFDVVDIPGIVKEELSEERAGGSQHHLVKMVRRLGRLIGEDDRDVLVAGAFKSVGGSLDKVLAEDGSAIPAHLR